jgi:hypothetical protein
VAYRAAAHNHAVTSMLASDPNHAAVWSSPAIEDTVIRAIEGHGVLSSPWDADFSQSHVEVFARKVLPQVRHLGGSTVACRKLVGNVPTTRYAPLWRTLSAMAFGLKSRPLA